MLRTAQHKHVAETIGTLDEGQLPADWKSLVVEPGLDPGDGEQAVYTVYRNQMPLGAVISVIAPDGYNGDIHLLLGVNFDGQITGVRVSEHRETPGLGDRIDISRSDWITHFNGQSLSSTHPSDWAEAFPRHGHP